VPGLCPSPTPSHRQPSLDPLLCAASSASGGAFGRSPLGRRRRILGRHEGASDEKSVQVCFGFCNNGTAGHRTIVGSNRPGPIPGCHLGPAQIMNRISTLLPERRITIGHPSPSIRPWPSVTSTTPRSMAVVLRQLALVDHCAEASCLLLERCFLVFQHETRHAEHCPYLTE
jgi:hypothetical protein